MEKQLKEYYKEYIVSEQKIYNLMKEKLHLSEDVFQTDLDEIKGTFLKLEVNMHSYLNELSEGIESHDLYIAKGKALLGCVYSQIGDIYRVAGAGQQDYDKEKLSETYFSESSDLLEQNCLQPLHLNAFIITINNLAILNFNRDNYENADMHLKKITKFYNEYKQKSENIAEDDYENLSDVMKLYVKNIHIKIENNYTLSLFYNAQVHKQLNRMGLSAKCCHETLKRQLEFNDYEKINWALDSATLSQYLVTNQRFTSARHHLAAATYMLHEYEKIMYTDDMNEDEKEAVLEKYNQRLADVYRCWSKYGLNLLEESKKHLFKLNDDDNDGDATAVVDNAEVNNVAEDDETAKKELLKFPKLDLSIYENWITDKYCLDYDDAMCVYITIKKWMELSQKYYSLELEATEYSKIEKDAADLFKLLAFFAENESNRCKIYKRAADKLENLLQSLNQQYYLNIFRSIWYELGSIYLTMLDEKIALHRQLVDENEPQSVLQHAVDKMIKIRTKAISQYEKFINSYKLPNTNELPVDLDEITTKTICFAYFYIANLYYKVKTRPRNIENLKESQKYFIMFKNESKKIPENHHSQDIKNALHVTEEMIVLLQISIDEYQY